MGWVVRMVCGERVARWLRYVNFGCRSRSELTRRRTQSGVTNVAHSSCIEELGASPNGSPFSVL